MTVDTRIRVPPTPVWTGHEQRPQRVSALARRIHGWTWQAVGFVLPTFYIATA
jgi:hypothetical protein